MKTPNPPRSGAVGDGAAGRRASARQPVAREQRCVRHGSPTGLTASVCWRADWGRGTDSAGRKSNAATAASAEVLRVRKPGQFAPGTRTRVRPDASGVSTNESARMRGRRNSQRLAARRLRWTPREPARNDTRREGQVKKPSPQSVLWLRHRLGRGPGGLQSCLNPIDALQRRTNRRETHRDLMVLGNEFAGTGVASTGRCREPRC
jgi:hypothetical protein